MEAVIRTAIFMRRPPGEGTTRETLRRECSMNPSERHRKFGMSQQDDIKNVSPWCILEMFGLSRPGGFQVKVERQRIPEAGDLRSFLFPSVLAATADERGLRFITREAFPLALIANEASIKYFF